MPKVNTLKGMASLLGISEDTLEEGLKSIKILNPSGSPKKREIENGNFNPDKTIKDYTKLKNDIIERLGL